MIYETLVADTKDEVAQKGVDYEKRYPSPGYGTIVGKPKYDPLMNKWLIDVSRGNSCD